MSSKKQLPQFPLSNLCNPISKMQNQKIIKSSAEQIKTVAIRRAIYGESLEIEIELATREADNECARLNRALSKYTEEVCRKAFARNHENGEGASNIGIEFGLTTRQADAAIDAGRVLINQERRSRN